MSGDVQPRKRKDKKRKKDDLGVGVGVSVIEPRGTAAALGDGDLFIHSHHDHGTGGHWCAKIVFFSLLAILIGLVGLIILENRGLSELEANAVQSQYSGVLEGWLEDAPEDDHHNEHTLELNHHDDEDDDDHELQHSEEAEDDEDNDHDEPQDDEENEEDEEPRNDDDSEDDEDGSQEQDVEANDEDEDLPYRKYYQDSQAASKDEEDDDADDDDENDEGQNSHDNDDDEDDDDEFDQDVKHSDEDNDDEFDEDGKHSDDDDANDNDEGDENDDEDDDYRNNQSVENDENSQENDNFDEGNDINDINDDTRDNEAESQEQNKEDDDEHEEEEEDASLEVEKIEQEASDENPISTELPALPEPDDDDDDKDQESAEDGADTDGDGVDTDDDDDGTDRDEADDFLDADDDDDGPPVERITAPAGKPFDEVEEETSSEKPADTLEEEEEYERRQEELRREEAQTSHMWLKLTVGGALLVATHAIVRRATASSDAPSEETASREESPTVDRRMTLIPEEQTEPVPIRRAQESARPVTQDVTKHIPAIIKSPPTFEESEEDVDEEEKEEPVVSKVVQAAQSKQAAKEELYSDEEDDEIEEEVVVKKAGPQVAKQPSPQPDPDEDVPDDVEIIDEEQIEEELEAEEDEEEEISDVDDEELLSRLEAKYGRLPEPERPQRHKDGGNSIADAWPGEPSDAYWRQQLDRAEREYNQGAWLAAADRASAKPLQSSARARYVVAKSLDAAAEKKRDNALLGRAIAAYLELLKMNERLSDKKLLQVTERTINRIQFRGNYLNAEPVYRLLIRRFPDEPSHRTNLTVTFLMANRVDLAEEVLKETLKLWPDNRLALAQYGFVLKTQHNRLVEAADYLQRALRGDTGPATEPRYYYHLGDTLLLLGRFDEAKEVHERGAKHGHFLSPSQRSLYNVPRLKGRSWWKVEDTPYVNLVRSLEKSWRAILREGLAAKALYEEEKEGLREKGEWSQLDLFVRGREVPGRCARAPVTCALVKAEPAAAGCRRGQVKFSSMEPGTHVRPHVGPTNCRLRMHLGLTNTKDTFLRVDRETRQWKAGEVLIFDDSFEHEVWHNGSGARLVLIVDVWHPDLTANERRQLPAI